jgi:hypothetical protein
MGDGAGPEVFSVLCGITAKSITDQVNTSDSFVRDCADPEDVPVREIISSGRQWSIRGSGQMNRANIQDIDEATGVIKNYRFFIARKAGEVAPALNGYYGGAAMITTKTINGDDPAYVGVDLTIESHGAWAWTDVP